MKKTAAMPSPTLRPRNPLAAPARCRGGAGQRALRRELQDLHPPHY